MREPMTGEGLPYRSAAVGVRSSVPWSGRASGAGRKRQAVRPRKDTSFSNCRGMVRMACGSNTEMTSSLLISGWKVVPSVPDTGIASLARGTRLSGTNEKDSVSLFCHRRYWFTFRASSDPRPVYTTFWMVALAVAGSTQYSMYLPGRGSWWLSTMHVPPVPKKWRVALVFQQSSALVQLKKNWKLESAYGARISMSCSYRPQMCACADARRKKQVVSLSLSAWSLQ
mmetsp:Transcript_18337/g.58475  ORF Transcript_18337/g.58475 Transcript_18337/m.58475 type:complete len:227 (+) Transcript_18337:684-1364(+)